MAINILTTGAKRDLREIPSDYKVTVYTGTFDPMHMGHLRVAHQVLNYQGYLGHIDLVFFYPHMHNTRKSPVPLSVRIDIAMKLIGNNTQLGVLVIEENEVGGPNKNTVSWVETLFKKLQGYHQLDYSRVISDERLEKAVEDNVPIVHFITPRQEYTIVGSVPQNFVWLPPQINPLSSTDLRNGKVPFGVEYRSLEGLINRHYPFGDFSQISPNFKVARD